MMQRRSTAIILLTSLSLLAWGMPIASAGAASEATVLTVQTATDRALSEGGRAERARLQLTEALLEAANLEHEHQMGPPRSRSLTLPVPEREPVTITLFEPARMDVARIERLLPVQFEAMREVARAAYAQEMAAVRAEAVTAFYAALLADEQVRVLEQSLSRFEAHHRRAEVLLERGMVPEIDVLRSQVMVAETRAHLRAAEGESEAALINLKTLIGLELDAEVNISHTPSFSAMEHLDPVADVQRGLEVRVEVIGARAGLAVAEKELALFTELHGGFRGRRSYRELSLAVETALHDLEEARRGTEAAVRTIHSRLAAIQGRMDARRQQLVLAQRCERIAVLRWEAGLGTVADLPDAAAAVREAETAHLETMIRYEMAAVEREALLVEGVSDVHELFEAVLVEISKLR